MDPLTAVSKGINCFRHEDSDTNTLGVTEFIEKTKSDLQPRWQFFDSVLMLITKTRVNVVQTFLLSRVRKKSYSN